MIEPSNIRGVVFDLGGVVLRICRTWAEGCRVAGVPVRDEGIERMLADGAVELVEAYQAGRVDFGGFTRTLAERSAGAYTVGEVDRVHRAWILGEYDGARSLIEALRRRGVPTLALSNTCPVHWEQMPEFPAFAALEHRIGSHLVGACKPDPRMYDAAEAMLPSGDGSIVFFDDTPPNVAAAMERGWSAHEIDPRDDPPGQIARLLGLDH